MVTPRFIIPFNIPETITIIAERILADGTMEYLIRNCGQEKTLNGTHELFTLLNQSDIRPGNTIEILKVANELDGKFVSRIVVNRVVEADQT